MTSSYAAGFETRNEATPAGRREAAASTRRSDRVADVIAERLSRAGCRRVHGIPGGEVLTLLDALHGAGLDFFAARHENAAGFMAEGGYRVDHRPGVVLATLGPGIANTANVAAHALQDGVPLILLTGSVGAATAARYTHQVIEQRRLLESVTKETFEITAECAPTQIDQAVQVAMAEPRGPVLVELPADVADAPRPAMIPRDLPPPVPAIPAQCPALEAARAALAGAARPIVIVGQGALRPGAPEALRRFVERHDAPCLTTYKAKGLLDEDHPLSLGGAGLSPRADDVLLAEVRQSDVVVLFGYDPVEMREPWIDPFVAGSEVVEIAAVAPRHRVHVATHLVIGDVVRTLESFGSAEATPGRRGIERAAGARAVLKELFGAGPDWGPGVIYDIARTVLPREARVTVDTGAHRIWMSQQWVSHVPDTMLQSSGFCTMACALPLAIGAKLADPGRDTVAFVGDAGLEMSLGELATLRDVGLSLPVVVLDDSSIELIAMKQRSRELPAVGCETGSTDFAAIARAFGGVGERVSDAETFRAALVRALSAPGLSLIQCALPRGAYDGRL